MGTEKEQKEILNYPDIINATSHLINNSESDRFARCACVCSALIRIHFLPSRIYLAHFLHTIILYRCDNTCLHLNNGHVCAQFRFKGEQFIHDHELSYHLSWAEWVHWYHHVRLRSFFASIYVCQSLKLLHFNKRSPFLANLFHRTTDTNW